MDSREKWRTAWLGARPNETMLTNSYVILFCAVACCARAQRLTTFKQLLPNRINGRTVRMVRRILADVVGHVFSFVRIRLPVIIRRPRWAKRSSWPRDRRASDGNRRFRCRSRARTWRPRDWAGAPSGRPTCTGSGPATSTWWVPWATVWWPVTVPWKSSPWERWSNTEGCRGRQVYRLLWLSITFTGRGGCLREARSRRSLESSVFSLKYTTRIFSLPPPAYNAFSSLSGLRYCPIRNGFTTVEPYFSR